MNVITEQILVETYSTALAREEGWFDKNKRLLSVAQRLNNPCLLQHWRDKAGTAYPEINGYVEFPNEDLGWRAGRAQCRINILKRKLTFYQFFAGKPGVYHGFLQYSDGQRLQLQERKSDPARYASRVMENVCAHLGIESATIDTPIFTLITQKKVGPGDVRKQS